jgi:hypothetical protein
MGCVTFSPHRNNIRVIRSPIMRWAGYVARWGRRQTKNRVLLGKTKEAGLFVDLGGRKLQDSIEMSFQEIRWHGVDCINLAENRTKWRALVNTVLAFGKVHPCTDTLS